MPLVELLVDKRRNVVGIRVREQGTARQLITSIGGANSFGSSRGISLENARLTYARIVDQSTRLTEEQRAPIRQRVLGLTVHDSVVFVEVPETQALFLTRPPPLGDAPSQLPSLVIVFTDP